MTRAEAIELVETAFEMWEHEWDTGDDWSKEHEARDMAVEALKSDPRIVRCKDCEWFRKEYGFNCIEFTVCGISPTHHPIRGEEDFCSKAKRRSDETD